MDRIWHEGHELRLVPGARECDKDLTKLVLEILQEDETFKLTGAQVCETFSNSKTIPKEKYRPPNKKSHIIGQFPIGEVREDIGDTTLSELRGRDTVFFITHPYNLCIPQEDGTTDKVDVETTLAQITSFGDILQENDVGIKQLTLVVPSFPYELNHSVKRHGRTGFIESNMLKKTIRNIAQSGYNEIITIATHSATTKELATSQGMHFRDINPFRSEIEVPSPKMGPFLYTSAQNTSIRTDYNSQMARLMPLVKYIREEFKDNLDDLCFVATDDGSEALIEKLAYAVRGDKQNVLSIIKGRAGPGETEMYGIKSSSTMTLEDIKGKICVIADDRRLSGGTLNDLANDLHTKYGAGRTVALIAHDMAYDTNITTHNSIDHFIFLETNPNSPIARLKDPRIYRLPMEATALLIAAEIFDSYVNMRDRGGIKIR